MQSSSIRDSFFMQPFQNLINFWNSNVTITSGNVLSFLYISFIKKYFNIFQKLVTEIYFDDPELLLHIYL